MSNWKRWIMVSGVVAGLGGAAVADDGGGAGARRERAHSINLNGGRALLGEYVVNYEYLAGHHGAIVEGGAAHDADGATSATTFGAAAGYRLHWRGQQNSGFVGVMAGFYVGSAATTTGGDDDALLADMERRGVVRRGKPGPMPAEIFQPGPAGPGVLAALLDERREGR